MLNHNETDQLKITWNDLKILCESNGVQDEDTLDFVHIGWGSREDLKCKRDEDFGWQIVLEKECAEGT